MVVAWWCVVAWCDVCGRGVYGGVVVCVVVAWCCGYKVVL